MYDPEELTQPPTPDDEAQALNAYLDTLQAKVHEARHQLLMGGKSITATKPINCVRGETGIQLF